MQAANSLCSPPQPNPGLPGFGQCKCINTDPQPRSPPLRFGERPSPQGGG